MSDLIERQAALDCVTYDVKYTVECIKELPSAQPERERGEWKNDKCSVCGYGVEPWNNTPFCPKCGADMR